MKRLIQSACIATAVAVALMIPAMYLTSIPNNGFSVVLREIVHFLRVGNQCIQL